jgi:hypothetical protein
MAVRIRIRFIVSPFPFCYNVRADIRRKRGGEHDNGAKTGNPAPQAPEGKVEEAADEGSLEREVVSLLTWGDGRS